MTRLECAAYAATMTRSVRVATLNVHGWRDASHSPNFDRLLDWLLPMQLDVLGLQEVSESARGLQNKRSRVFILGVKLGMPHHVTVQDVAVLSRWPILHCTLIPRDTDTSQVVLRQDPATLFAENVRHQRRLIVAEICLLYTSPSPRDS